MQKIGQITLQISFVLYLIYLIPQILHNAKLKSTKGLSLAFHLILFIAYVADLIYGFGLNFPWQYKAVSLTGLLMLCIQHFQFAYSPEAIKGFTQLTACISCFLLLVSVLIWFFPLNENVFLGIGYLSQFGWLTYSIPQIVENHRSGSATSLSLNFIVLAVLISLCDTFSAWLLNWPLPSKIGAPISLFLKLLLLWQCLIIRK